MLLIFVKAHNFIYFHYKLNTKRNKKQYIYLTPDEISVGDSLLASKFDQSIADGLRLHKVSAFATCGFLRDVSRRDLSSDSLGRWTKTPQKLTVSSRSGLRITESQRPSSCLSRLLVRIVANLITIMTCSLGSQQNGMTARLFPESFQQASRRELLSICHCNQGP